MIYNSEILIFVGIYLCKAFSIQICKWINMKFNYLLRYVVVFHSCETLKDNKNWHDQSIQKSEGLDVIQKCTKKPICCFHVQFFFNRGRGRTFSFSFYFCEEISNLKYQTLNILPSKNHKHNSHTTQAIATINEKFETNDLEEASIKSWTLY